MPKHIISDDVPPWPNPPDPFSGSLPPQQALRRSLSARLRAAVWLLAGGLLLFVSLTGAVTWRLEERAAAIHQAARLNDRVHRLSVAVREPGAALPVKEVETELARLADPQPGLCCNWWREPAAGRLSDVRARTAALLGLAGQADAAAFAGQAERLHRSIDAYAQVLEEQNARSIGWLRMGRIGLVLLIVLSAAVSFRLLRQGVLRPLGALYQAMSRLTQGCFDTRLALRPSGDEFEALADGFNRMAGNLQEMYAHLEDKVTEKTAALLRQKSEWEMLYYVTSYLHKQSFGSEVEQAFLERMLRLSDSVGGGLFWHTENGFAAACVHGLPEDVAAKLPGEPDAPEAGGAGEVVWMQAGGEMLALVLVEALGGFRGWLALADPRSLSARDVGLIRLLCTQLGIARENAAMVLLKQQNAVLEERNRIARSLHDSLAQSLSFINMRFQMLSKNKLLPDDKSVRDNIEMIRNGIQYCYEDVRELLDHFRAQPQYGNFAETVRSVIERSRRQSGIPVALHLAGGDWPLNSEQQTQALFILQEALSNIRKHAAATQAEVRLENADGFTMTVRDNGCGFDVAATAAAPGQHIGLAVMRERAEKIGAQIGIASQPGGGTEVRLHIPAV
ncbi:histidine kinase [Eikenella sp. Marseille-P7795]|uniref:histidine kinase n=1 Tax=Eikenella sp. Marseille-P7795 TaxID=2866577 RepID=UPI001CE4337A|nr:histidine kinase [Eikenella sp. Marseille-P7795]